MISHECTLRSIRVNPPIGYFLSVKWGTDIGLTRSGDIRENGRYVAYQGMIPVIGGA